MPLAHLFFGNEILHQWTARTQSPIQLIITITNFRDSFKESCNGVQSAERVAKAMNERFDGIAHDEMSLSDSIVDMALTVGGRAFTNTKILSLVMEDAERPGKKKLWDTISKLHVMVVKSSKDSNDIEFNFKFVQSMYEEDLLPHYPSSRDLADGKHNKKGLLEIVNFIHSLNVHALNIWTQQPELGLSSDCRAMLKDNLADPQRYMELIKSDDQRFRGKLDTKIAERVWEHLEDLFFSGRHWDAYETIIKRKIPPEDVFTKQEWFRPGFEEIEELIQAEKKAKNDSMNVGEAEHKVENVSTDPNKTFDGLQLTAEQAETIRNLNDESTSLSIAKRKKARVFVRTHVH